MASTQKTITLSQIAAPQTPTVSTLSSKQKLEVTPLVIPARFTWSPGQEKPPSIQPLKTALDPTKGVPYIKSVTLGKTHSNAAGPTVPVLITGLEPTPISSTTPHKLETYKPHYNKDGHSFIVPKDTHVHNTKLWENPTPGFASKSAPQSVDIEKLKVGTVAVSEKSKQINSVTSPELYQLVESKLKLLGANATKSKALNGGSAIEIQNTELDKLLEQYKQSLGEPKTNPLEHTVTLQTWDDASKHFGKTHAAGAVHGDLRNNLLAADTNHEIVTELHYELVYPSSQESK